MQTAQSLRAGRGVPALHPWPSLLPSGQHPCGWATFTPNTGPPQLQVGDSARGFSGGPPVTAFPRIASLSLFLLHCITDHNIPATLSRGNDFLNNLAPFYLINSISSVDESIEGNDIRHFFQGIILKTKYLNQQRRRPWKSPSVASGH